ncbi:MAG: hypothetical protein HYV09_37230 [Deltaproteobacteria bacterium]|nr:hypothetical protein [Deltaproteobacteria bacterium]
MRAPQVVTLYVALSLGACAGAHRAPPKQPEWGPWSAMTPQQKHDYMTEVVMPEVKRVFVAFDPHAYPKADCTLCHGKDEDSKMPNPDLLLEPEAVVQRDAPAPDETLAFMRDQVTPMMARLLGRALSGPTAPKGFDCWGCHTRDE